MNPAQLNCCDSSKGSSKNLLEVLRNPLCRTASAIVVADDRNDKSSMVHAADYIARTAPRKEKAAIPESGSGNAACSFR